MPFYAKDSSKWWLGFCGLISLESIFHPECSLVQTLFLKKVDEIVEEICETHKALATKFEIHCLSI